MKLCTAIHKRIASLCKEQKLSYNELANRSSIQRSVINNLMVIDTRYPTLLTLYKISKGFGMTLCEFFDCSLFENVTED